MVRKWAVITKLLEMTALTVWNAAWSGWGNVTAIRKFTLNYFYVNIVDRICLLFHQACYFAKSRSILSDRQVMSTMHSQHKFHNTEIPCGSWKLVHAEKSDRHFRNWSIFLINRSLSMSRAGQAIPMEPSLSCVDPLSFFVWFVIRFWNGQSIMYRPSADFTDQISVDKVSLWC